MVVAADEVAPAPGGAMIVARAAAVVRVRSGLLEAAMVALSGGGAAVP